MADCPLHDFGELTQLDSIEAEDAAQLAKLGITNVRQLREALANDVQLPGFVEGERRTWARELRDSDLRAVENQTTRHTEPNAGDAPPAPPSGGGRGTPPDDGGPIRPAPQVAPGVRRILNRLGRFGPNVELRALSSPNERVRRLFGDLMTSNLRLVDDGQPVQESVNAVIKGWHAHGNLAAERAHEAYLRYLLDIPVGQQIRDRATLLKAVAKEAKATARRGNKVARHVYNELLTIALERGGDLAPGDGRLVGLTGDLDPALREAVLDGARHKRQFYDAAFGRREQTGQAVLRRETYSPRFWDFDKVTGREAELQEAIAANLTQKARAWISEGRMTPEEFAQVEAYIRDQLPRYVDTVATASYMRLPDEFAEFLTGSRSVRERTFGQIVLGEGETQRFLEPDFDVIAPYLHLDSMELLNRYLHSSIVDMELTARFGDVRATERIAEIRDDYATQIEALREGRAPAGERAQLAARAESDIQDMEMLIAAMRNTDRIPSSPTSVAGIYDRTLAAIRNYTYLRIGGGMGIPSLGDVAAIATEHGVRRTMTQVVREFRDGFDTLGRQHSSRDFEALYLTFNDIGRQMGRNLFDISSYPAFGSTRFERLLAEGSNTMSTLNLLRPWTNIAKQAAARLIVSHVDEIGEKLARGMDVAHELELFRAAGLSEPDVRRLHELRNLYGGKEGHYTWLGIERWAAGDRELANRFRNALIREVDRVVVTPGVQDVPFLMRQPTASTLLQFRKFGFSHTNRVLLPAMQAVAAGDLSVLHGMGLTFGVGATVYMLKELTNKRELPTDIGRILQESIARSDLWGIVGEMDGMSGAFTGGVVTARGWLAPETFYGNRYMVSDVGSAILGPGLNSVEELGRAFVAASSVTPFVTSTDRDVRAVRRVWPGQNFFYTDFLADVVEEGLSGAAAYFEGKPRDRQMEAIR